jgi:hypothetical protein
MEVIIIVALVAAIAIWYFNTQNKTTIAEVETVPYKVETPTLTEMAAKAEVVAAKPVAAISFGACTGGSSAITHFAIGVAATGASKVLYAGTVSPSITVTAGITPQLTTNTSVNED